MLYPIEGVDPPTEKMAPKDSGFIMNEKKNTSIRVSEVLLRNDVGAEGGVGSSTPLLSGDAFGWVPQQGR